MMRLFIALPLETGVEEQLGNTISLMKQKGGSVKWVAPQNIHLTVKFLGDTEESLVDRIKEQIDTAASDYEPVRSRIDRVGAFPNLRRPRVIWAGLAEGIEALAQIAADIDGRMHSLGWEKETRRFKPHLTLGRVRDSRDLENLAAFIKDYEMAELPFTFDRLVLFKSTLMPRGPIYDRLYETVLGA